MFENILIPLDRSLLAENILPHAAAVALANNSQITLISVMGSALENNHDSLVDPFDWQMRRAEAEAYLNNVASGLTIKGLTVKTVLLDGKAPDEVIQHAISLQSDLIMLSSHGQGGISSWNISSVVMKIIQQVNTSIMIIRSSSAPESISGNLRYRKILVPVDGSTRAEYSLYTAANLARKHGAKLILAHVISPPEFPRKMPLSTQDRALLQSVVESNRLEGSRYLDAFKESLDCQVGSCLIISESVTEALHTLVAQEEIDLVVLNAHGQGGNPRRPYGNVPVNFLTYSTTPVLIVQDFNRDELIQSQTRGNDKEIWNLQRPILEGSSRKFFDERSR